MEKKIEKCNKLKKKQQSLPIQKVQYAFSPAFCSPRSFYKKKNRNKTQTDRLYSQFKNQADPELREREVRRTKNGRREKPQGESGGEKKKCNLLCSIIDNNRTQRKGN